MRDIDKLCFLYKNQSKHANYQILPRKLQPFFESHPIQIKSRHEEERLNFIKANINISQKSLLDIGGNTGFFTFELLDSGATSATLYEGNRIHAEFVHTAAKLLNLSNRLTVINSYFDSSINGISPSHFNVTLLMNVLHHIGDDYGDKSITINKARELVANSLKNLAAFTDILAFQIGYCWKGNRNLPLFKTGSKQEQIDFLIQSTENYWKVSAIGIPQITDQKIAYEKPTKENMNRQDGLGEFLNRPLFILKSLAH